MATGRIRAEREARILRAAERVFARHGLAGATMAAIADEAGLPRANLHYYFRDKAALHRALLADTLDRWLAGTDLIRAGNDPREALAHYVREKMRWSRERPEASRVFADALLHGADGVEDMLSGELRALVERKAAVIDGWIAAGRMAPLDARHLFFTIWAATQTWADFEPQIRAVLGVDGIDAALHARATEDLVAFLLRGCGLDATAGDAAPACPDAVSHPAHPARPRPRPRRSTSTAHSHSEEAAP